MGFGSERPGNHQLIACKVFQVYLLKKTHFSRCFQGQGYFPRYFQSKGTHHLSNTSQSRDWWVDIWLVMYSLTSGLQVHQHTEILHKEWTCYSMAIMTVKQLVGTQPCWPDTVSVIMIMTQNPIKWLYTEYCCTCNGVHRMQMTGQGQYNIPPPLHLILVMA